VIRAENTPVPVLVGDVQRKENMVPPVTISRAISLCRICYCLDHIQVGLITTP
jgi:hypothetical protein